MDLLEQYLERVAIMEVDAGMPTAEAQWKAYLDLQQCCGDNALPKEIIDMAEQAKKIASTKEIPITLDEFALAVQCSLDRMIESNKQNLNHATTYSRGFIKRLHEEVLGCLGEMAFAKYRLKDGFVPEINTFHKQADVDQVEVRSTDKENGSLIVRSNDVLNRTFVLAIVKDRSVVLAGWLKGFEAQEDQYLKDPNGYRPAWFVPQDELRPMPDK